MLDRMRCVFADREWTEDEIRLGVSFLGEAGCACPKTRDGLRALEPCEKCARGNRDCDALDLARRYLEDGV